MRAEPMWPDAPVTKTRMTDLLGRLAGPMTGWDASGSPVGNVRRSRW